MQVHPQRFSMVPLVEDVKGGSSNSLTTPPQSEASSVFWSSDINPTHVSITTSSDDPVKLEENLDSGTTLSRQHFWLYRNTVTMAAFCASIITTFSSLTGLTMILLTLDETPSNQLWRGDRDAFIDAFILSSVVSLVEAIFYGCLYFLCSVKQVDKIKIGTGKLFFF